MYGYFFKFLRVCPILWGHIKRHNSDKSSDFQKFKNKTFKLIIRSNNRLNQRVGTVTQAAIFGCTIKLSNHYAVKRVPLKKFNFLISEDIFHCVTDQIVTIASV